jgi:hypothetical protein
MRHLRFAAIAVALFAVAGTAFAGSASHSTNVPTNLHGFLLRANEPTTNVFPRTPAFAWAPVSGALCYEFELGTSKNFTQNTLIWSNVSYGVGAKPGCRTVNLAATNGGVSAGSSSSSSSSSSGSTPPAAPSDPAVPTTIAPLRVPAVSVDVALPWFTGSPYALYAHARAITSHGATGWSKPFGFNMRWDSVAKPLKADPDLIRWTPVPGATAYQVWYTDANKVFSTHTNVADEREYYTFHADPTWTSTVHWRIRAVRRVYGSIPNGLPAVSFGPWSPVYTATNPAPTSGPLTLRLAISDQISTAGKQAAHELMPALYWTGDTVSGRQYGLFRVYAFTDKDCVNTVFVGSVVGGPAFAPRTTGPLKLPTSDADLTLATQSFLPSASNEGTTYSADGQTVVTNEAVTSSSDSSSSSSSSSSGSGAGSVGYNQLVTGAKVDLPDLNFPSTRYFWTVVPVLAYIDDSGNLSYHDVEVPQDACAAGRIMSFGKGSEPVVSASGTPYVAGLSPTGRLLTSATRTPTVYGTPLVAWQPAKGASAYEVQWSRKAYPWATAGRKVTYATSALLNLKPGKWYYRVRGLNLDQLVIPYMSWSQPVRITVARPTFRLIASR